ncbi:sugar phosphate isomerase/epimerase family protein [Massilibacteroides vaginae]|uniref:sugar phosphate isomerase/epimerase family protein n=1 Tax=Massilibacteroides vaginae TaxID=1673718 RepID=UPI000A1CD02D|nr:sugar phosphate isomerase/epimerase [Massilibacteroides vaginae]
MKVGIQLYSVRNSMANDPIGTLKEVAEIGYKNIEIANHNAEVDPGVGFNVSAEEINKTLQECGAKVISGHVFPFRAETMDAILAYHAQIGTKFLVMPMDFYADRDEVLRKSEILNNVGAKCREAGIEFVYHNHFHEFQEFGGKTIYEMIMENTDPQNLKIELDSYWALRGGQDIASFMKKYGKRIRLLHQKDFPAQYKDQFNLIEAVHKNAPVVDLTYFESVVSDDTFTEIGHGILNIQGIINTATEHCDVEYIILEQDFSKLGELESLKVSMESFKKFNGIEW